MEDGATDPEPIPVEKAMHGRWNALEGCPLCCRNFAAVATDRYLDSRSRIKPPRAEFNALHVGYFAVPPCTTVKVHTGACDSVPVRACVKHTHTHTDCLPIPRTSIGASTLRWQSRGGKAFFSGRASKRIRDVSKYLGFALKYLHNGWNTALEKPAREIYIVGLSREMFLFCLLRSWRRARIPFHRAATKFCNVL